MSPSSTDAPHFTHDLIPMGVIPVLATISSHYREALIKMITTANAVYREFLRTDGAGFSGSVSIIGMFKIFISSFVFFILHRINIELCYHKGDCMGAVLAHDALCYSKLDKEDIIPKSKLTLKKEITFIPKLDLFTIFAHIPPPPKKKKNSYIVQSSLIKTRAADSHVII